jgi:hypothetical protein
MSEYATPVGYSGTPDITQLPGWADEPVIDREELLPIAQAVKDAVYASHTFQPDDDLLYPKYFERIIGALPEMKRLGWVERWTQEIDIDDLRAALDKEVAPSFHFDAIRDENDAKDVMDWRIIPLSIDIQLFLSTAIGWSEKNKPFIFLLSMCNIDWNTITHWDNDEMIPRTRSIMKLIRDGIDSEIARDLAESGVDRDLASSLLGETFA